MDDEKERRTKETDIEKFRKMFRDAVDAANDWQNEAQEDYDFVAGQQWTEDEKKAFEKERRPAITINRIKPLLNILSGYQRLNRYDIDFLPRTSDDQQVCEVRKGLTKYILDSCDYDSQEAHAFLDAVIGGVGWFDVGYEFNEDSTDGEAYVRREDPFSIYPDPETHKPDYSDMAYICRAKWVDKDELKLAYPKYAEDIEAQYQVYDSAELEENKRIDPLWYKSDLKKVRLVECWYKKKEKQTLYYLTDGRAIPQGEMRIDYLLSGMVEEWQSVNRTVVRCCVFMDRILLEDIPSPYRNGDFPFVPIICYHYGAGDIPAGIVRDLKDPQREINRRRIQQLHILNTSSNGGGWIEEDAMTEEQWREFQEEHSTPGHFQKVRPGKMGSILERQPSNPPTALIQAEAQATQDLTAISGINEALMGTDIPSQSSGRAIELKQKQAITHIAPMFDHLRKAKKKVAFLLWGRQGNPGVIPQFYTEDKVYRVEGVNGQQFIHVNQQVIQQDPIAGTIVATLNDLSHGEFDIVIADTQASTTQRQAQMWGLVDAVSKLQIPGDLVFDMILDLSDLPNKDEIKARWQQRQMQQMQMQQAELQQKQQEMQMKFMLEQSKRDNMNQSIAFKDAPLPIQFAMAAKAGLIDQQVAEYAVNLMVQNMFPGLSQALAQQRQVNGMLQSARNEQQAQAQLQQAQQAMQQQSMLPMQPQQPATQQNRGSNMTQAAAQSLMDGAAPAAL